MDRSEKVDTLVHQWEFTKNVIISANGFLLTVLSCCRIPPTDGGSCFATCCRAAQSDTYCKLSLLSTGHAAWNARTIVIKDDDNPAFNQQFYVACTDIRHDILRIEVWDEDIMRDEKIGFVNIGLWDVLHLIREPDVVETMGLDNASLKVQFRLQPFPGKEHLIADYRSTVYVGFRARATDQHLQRARLLTARGMRSGQSHSASLASSTEETESRQHSTSSFEAVVPPPKPKRRPMTSGNKVRPHTPAELAARRIPDTVHLGTSKSARMHAEFRRFDIDQNGAITSSELQQICERMTALGILADPLHVDDILSRAPDNITFPEYERLMSELLQ